MPSGTVGRYRINMSITCYKYLCYCLICHYSDVIMGAVASNHQPHHCLHNRLFSCRSKKTSKLHVTGLCAGNSLVTGEFPAQMVSNAENVLISWRHHGCNVYVACFCRTTSLQCNKNKSLIIHHDQFITLYWSIACKIGFLKVYHVIKCQKLELYLNSW